MACTANADTLQVETLRHLLTPRWVQATGVWMSVTTTVRLSCTRSCATASCLQPCMQVLTSSSNSSTMAYMVVLQLGCDFVVYLRQERSIPSGPNHCVLVILSSKHLNRTRPSPFTKGNNAGAGFGELSDSNHLRLLVASHHGILAPSQSDPFHAM